MGPGGSRGLQNRCGAAYVVPGGFDSLALPPPISILKRPGFAPIRRSFGRRFSPKYLRFDSDVDSTPSRAREEIRDDGQCGTLLRQTLPRRPIALAPNTVKHGDFTRVLVLEGKHLGFLQ